MPLVFCLLCLLLVTGLANAALAPLNAAEEAALARPAFSITDPPGYVSDEEEKQQQREAWQKLEGDLKTAIASGQHDFTVPPGEYRFPSATGFVLADVSDFTLHATGAYFWSERPEADLLGNPQGLNLLRCHNVTIEGLTLDFDPALWVQGQITSLDLAANTVDIAPDPDFPSPAGFGGGQLFFFRPDGRLLRQGVPFHEGLEALPDAGLRVHVRPGQLQWMNEDKGVQAAFGGASTVQVGDWVVAPFRRGHAIRMELCESCSLVGCTVYASPGAGIVELGGAGGNRYVGHKLIRKPGARRLWASTADAFFSALVDRGPTLEGCEFSFTADDLFNLHGYFALVTHRLAPNQIIVMPMNYEPFAPGGKLTFYDWRSCEQLGEATITAVEKVTDEAVIDEARAFPGQVGLLSYSGAPFLLTLDNPVELAPGAIVDTHNANDAGFVIQDCYFHDSTARCGLISGASNGLIEHNVWRDLGGGLSLYMESWFYNEGPMPHDVTVRGNRFLDILLDPRSADAPVAGLLYTGMVPPGNYLRTVAPLTNLVFEDNLIDPSPGPALVMAYVKGGAVRNNTFRRPFSFIGKAGGEVSPEYYGKSLDMPLYFTVCEDIEVSGNVVEDPEGFCESGAVGLGPLCKAIILDGDARQSSDSDYVAEALTGFSNLQGARGWSYGYWIEQGEYSTEGFCPMDEFGGIWWRVAGQAFPFIRAVSIHPGDWDGQPVAAIRRWTSSVDGSVEVFGELHGSGAGNGTLARIFVDGKEAFRVDLTDGEPHGYSTHLQELREGSLVDFVLTSKGDLNSDATRWTIELR